jgi:Ca2+-binding RTX toxin-like protein
MSIGATYDAVHRQLQLTVDQNGDAIEITRDAAGTIFVNGGATPVQGGPATVANTDVIEFFGDVGNDTFSLDESNGTLPPTTMFGGAGNDTLTGGSGQAIIDGGAGATT